MRRDRGDRLVPVLHLDRVKLHVDNVAVAAELGRLSERERQLEAELREARAAGPVVELDDETLRDDVVASQELGSSYGVSSTPSVVVNGELLVAPSWEELDAAIVAAAEAAG